MGSMTWRECTHVQVGALETKISCHTLSGRKADVAAVEVANEHQEHHDGRDEAI